MFYLVFYLFILFIYLLIYLIVRMQMIFWVMQVFFHPVQIFGIWSFKNIWIPHTREILTIITYELELQFFEQLCPHRSASCFCVSTSRSVLTGAVPSTRKPLSHMIDGDWRCRLSPSRGAEAAASTRLWLPLGLIDAIHRSGPGGSPSRKWG